MYWKGHTGSVLLTAAVASTVLEPGLVVPATALATLATLAPDLYGNWTSLEREATHSLLAVAAAAAAGAGAAALAAPLSIDLFPLNPVPLIAAGAAGCGGGLLLHLVLDTLVGPGSFPLYPLSKRGLNLAPRINRFVPYVHRPDNPLLDTAVLITGFLSATTAAAAEVLIA